jgi:subtilisin family serine protease
VSGSLEVSLAKFAGRTGRGVRIAVVDSGIHGTHPHVGLVAGGVTIDESGGLHDGAADQLGHGTAVAAAIREKAPETILIPVRVFHQALTTTAVALTTAIRWAVDQHVSLINLSLGTAEETHRASLEQTVSDAAARGVIIVAAAPQSGTNWLPGALAHVVAVEADWERPRDTFAVQDRSEGDLLIRASGYPRPIPGTAAARNFKGPSFAVANATGLIALAIEGQPVRSVADVRACFA